MKTIGNRLKELRTDKNMTQQELADKMGIKRQIVNYYENDNRQPKIDDIKELSKIFGVSSDYLLGSTDFKNFDDLLNNMQSTEKLVDYINRLDKEDNEILSSTLNGFLDYLVNSSLYNKENKYAYIMGLACYISCHKEMIKKAQAVYLILSEKIINSEDLASGISERDDSLLYKFLDFIKTKDDFMKEVENFYCELALKITSCVKNKKLKSAIIKDILKADKIT